MPLVLLVDPDLGMLNALENSLQSIARVESSSDFLTARHLLLTSRPDRLITNLRLGPFNGLHLVYLASVMNLPTRSVVYADVDDPVLAREIRAVGAFYQRRSTIPYAVVPLVTRALPSRDRRDPGRVDRRQQFRGGRRATDRSNAEI